MNKGFRQSQAFLHTWSGLLLGWVMFVIFVAGSIAFWRDGLNRWMRPELDGVVHPHRVLAGAQAYLSHTASDAKGWRIAMPGEGTVGAKVYWEPRPKPGQPQRTGHRRGDNQALIDAHGHPAQARDTKGGDFFYRFHFDLHYMPVIWARWLVGVAAMAMLVAILTGIVTHKKIFRDFFTFRGGKGPRTWLDGHNAAAVLALPFHLMITYTGLVTLMAMLMPWAVVANYADRQALADQIYPEVEHHARTGRPAPLVDLVSVVRDAERRLGTPAGYVTVSEPGDAAATVSVSGAQSASLSSRTPALAYDGVSGELIWASPQAGVAVKTAGVMVGLHAGRYADGVMHWIYFLCGLAGSVMIASGLVLWTVKRRAKYAAGATPPLGFRVVERLNIAVVAGFPFAIAAMLWANRLLPTGLTNRAEWEVHGLFIGWALALAAAAALAAPRAWRVLLGTTGAMLMALPLYNALATPRGLPAAIASAQAPFYATDLALLVFGAAFILAARRVRRAKAPLPEPARPMQPLKAEHAR